jgi:hypothetical protein
LAVEEFAAFVQDCELEFDYRLPEPDVSQMSDLLVAQQDLRTLTEHLFAIVADPQRIVELTRDELC